ncbi:hypothetical protein ACFL5V_04715 [Fibrobacterota bacterium]
MTLLFLLGLALRVIGNGWGLVSTAALADAGCPMPDIQERPGTVGSYVYDEEAFGTFLPCVSLSAEKDEDHDLEGTPVRSNLHSYMVEKRKQMIGNPLSPLFYAWWTRLIGRFQGDSEKRLQECDGQISLFYNTGRYFTALMSMAALVPFMLIMSHVVRKHDDKKLLSFGAAILFCFQPAIVVHSHWISYNPLMVLLQLMGFWLFIRLCQGLKSGPFTAALKWSLLFGMVTGAGIAVKDTAISLAVFAVAGLLLMAFQEYGFTGCCIKYWKSGYFRSSLLIVFFTYLAYVVLTNLFVETAVVPATMKGSSYNLFSALHLETVIHYFSKTLPAGLGWPVYAAGIFGLAVNIVGYRKLSIERKLLIIWAGTLILGFTSTPLGRAPQRSLMVYCLWIYFAVWFLEALLYRSRAYALLLSGYLILGCATACFLVDYFLVEDTRGYRTEASRYVLEHIPHGSTLVFNSRQKHSQIDLGMFEDNMKQDGARLYDYKYRYYWKDLEPEWKGYAVYFKDRKPGLQELAEFESIIKKEKGYVRYLRMGLGFHRFDQLIRVPSYSIYRIAD